ncbi:carbonic anhydrase [Peribacillus sp. SCS-155]|uniref:carbonic anhydrase n=1 Tax=Peribacillus sedimenti TaxID=3115297 RepID=UPI003905F6A7
MKQMLMALMMFNLLAAGGSAESAEPEQKQKWSYSGTTGPLYWGTLDPSYEACKKGKAQSPINIKTAVVEKSSEYPLVNIHYATASFNISNTGYTIQAVPHNQKNRLLINNETFTLKQFHIHHLSEHEINNLKYSMEIHLVHQNAKGNIAVVGVFVKEGQKNEVLKDVLDHMPNTTGSEQRRTEIKLDDLLPKVRDLYTYKGSLTTPPCTENVTWFIFREPIEMAGSQISVFAKLYPANYRPIQPLNMRKVSIVSLLK